MKKLLCLVSTLVFTLSLCACSKDDDSKSVKIPDNSSSKASLTYEEAIVPFQGNKELEKICDRAYMILKHIECVNYYYNGNSDYTLNFEDKGIIISNKNGIGDSMNALEEYFKSEPQYTEYMSNISNAVLKNAYLKFIDLAEEIYQKFVDNPTESVTDEINMSALGQYYDSISFSDISRPDYYLAVYTGVIEHNFWYIEAYCKLTPEEIKRLKASDQSTPYERRMLNATHNCYIGFFTDTAEGIDLDFAISMLDSLMMLKENAHAIAVEAYGSDSQKLAAYEDFINQATELYNKVRVNRPEFNDTEYIKKQEFDLDPLYEYVFSD